MRRRAQLGLILSLGVAALLLAACSESKPPVYLDQGEVPDTTPAPTDGQPEAAADSSADLPADQRTDVKLCGGISCDDKLPCTDDLCVATGCVNQVKPGFCVINGTCYNNGQAQATGSCNKCDPSQDNKIWSEDASLCKGSGLACTTVACTSGTCSSQLLNGYCLIGGLCLKQAETNPKNSCKFCNNVLSTNAYQDKPDGYACDDDGLTCTADQCKGGSCDHPLKAGFCKISGTCYYKGELNGVQACKVCDPIKATTAWSTQTDGAKCFEDGLTCTADQCKSGACTHTIKSGTCLIGGICYGSGQVNPTAPCQQCTPTLSTTAWSNKTNGAACKADALSCTADVCQAGKCTHTLKSSSCLIGGKCYAQGASQPGQQCVGCNPGVSSSSWTKLPDGYTCPADSYSCTTDHCKSGVCTHTLISSQCLIGGACYKTGQQHPVQSCLQCMPSLSSTNWSGANNGAACASDGLSCTDDKCLSGTCDHSIKPKTCLIGNACYSEASLNPTNQCQHCSTGSSVAAWTERPTGTICSGGKCAGGQCCKGCVSGSNCLPGNSPGSCGTAGGACTACPTGHNCPKGICVWGGGQVQHLNIGSHQSTYTSTTSRGFWFTAPISFIMVGVRVPLNVGTQPQTIQVIRLTTPPPSYPGTTTSFSTLAYFKAVPGTSFLAVNIAVSAGQHIGILGGRGTTSTLSTSYGSTGGYSSSIKGYSMTLGRLLIQSSIFSSPAGPVATEQGGNLGRIEMQYH